MKKGLLALYEDNATLRPMMENVDSADTMKDIVYEIFKRVAKGNLNGTSIPIGKITDFGIDYLKEVTGNNFGKDTLFVLNLSDLKHIFDRHYETDRYPNNARALNGNDIKAIVDLMMTPESITPVSGSDNKYWFFMPNGIEVSVLLDVKGKKKLMPMSYYIAKAGNMSSNNDYVNRIQVATSKTRTTNPAYNTNIPLIFDFANSFSNENIKRVEDAASFRVTPAQDAEYTSALETGNTDKAQQMQKIKESADELAQALGINVKYVENTDDIQDDNKKRLQRKRSSKGWYDTETGEITVVIPNNDSVADAQATILHEIVGHKGMREIVGEENYNDFLEKVYRAADVELRKRITELAARKGWDFNLATEEYIASLSESGFKERQERNLLEKIRDLFVDMFRRAKIAIGFHINDNDLRYMLWRSYKGRIKSVHKKGVFCGQMVDFGRFIHKKALF